MTFGLVLGAGGQAGEAFHRGVLRAMIDLGVDPRRADAIVGTSAGSVVASSLRRHTQPPGSEAGAVQRLRPRSNRSSALGLVRRPRQALNALLLAPEFTRGRQSVEFLREGLAGKHQQWPSAELFVVAVRRSDGRRVVFGTDQAPTTDVGTAVAASCAIPSYFSPVHIDGHAYVDGGAHSPSNADVVAADQPELVVVVSPMTMGQGTARRPRPDTPVRMAVRRYLAREVRQLRRRGAEVVVLQPGPEDLPVMGLNPMQHSRVEDVLDVAARSTRARLEAQPALVELLSGS